METVWADLLRASVSRNVCSRGEPWDGLAAGSRLAAHSVLVQVSVWKSVAVAIFRVNEQFGLFAAGIASAMV